jgi:enoyl-CoA hydratase
MPVELTFRDDCAILTLNRPEALNALSFSIIDEIGTTIDRVAKSSARALIITGAGTRAFCAGADIKELGGRDLIAKKRGVETGQAVFAKLDTLPVASIAVINGFAFGGGLEFALACTFRIATPDAKMACPEIKLGLIPGYGGTQRLPRIVGEARALELVMTGRTVDALEAERIGLISRIVNGDPVAEGVTFAKSFTKYSLPALGFARAAVQRALTVPLQEGLKIEADLSTLAYGTHDAAEGIAAFIEKRPPRFHDG